MNVWIFNHYAQPPDLPGGARHYNLARQLVRRGHRVVIFASGFQHHLRREVRLAPGNKWRIAEVEGIKFVWVRTFPYRHNNWRRMLNMVEYMFRAWWLGRKAEATMSGVSRPDVVIGSSVHLLAVLAAYWVAKRYQAQFVMEVRDLWPQTLIDMNALNEAHPLTKILKALERFLYRRATRIITLLPKAIEYFTARGISNEKIVWIPNGVDLSKFKNINPKRRDHSEFRVFYLGAHGQANALDVLLKAAKIIQSHGDNNIKFTLIGDGSEKPKLIQLAKKLQLKNVEFSAPVNKNEVSRPLQEADALVFNLEKAKVFKYGISSNKLFDYMASGRPILFSVLASNNPVEEAKCGITVSPQNPLALAEAIKRLARMPASQRWEMGLRGRRYVEENHNMVKLGQKLENVLQQVLEESYLSRRR